MAFTIQRHAFPRSFRLRAMFLFMAAGMVAIAPLVRTASADDAEKTYPVKLFTAGKVGEKFTIVQSGEQKASSEVIVGSSAPVTQGTNLQLKLEGTLETLAVDSKGNTTKLACTIKKFERTDGKDAVEILPAGTVVTVDSTQKKKGQKDSKTEYTLPDGKPTPEQTEALKLMLDTAMPESPTEEEVFGTATPRKVGEKWDADASKIAESAADSGIKVDAKDVHGQASIAGVSDVGGKPYIDYKYGFTAENLDLGVPDLQMKSSKIEFQMTSSLPADGSKATTKGSQEMKMQFTAAGATPEGQPISVHAKVSMIRHREVTPIGE